MSALSRGRTLKSRSPSVDGIDGAIEAAMIAASILVLLLLIGFPVVTLFKKSFENSSGEFTYLENYKAYFSQPRLLWSVWNSFWTSAVVVTIVLPLSFIYAYALTRSTLGFKSIFYSIALLPILAPSLLGALSLVYIFGNQGFLRGLMGGNSIYGATGIIGAQVFFSFPHAFLLIYTALSFSDQRLYEACDALGAGRMTRFFRVTLPATKYGVLSAIFVTFTLVITDFGIPKIIGGRFSVLATDVYQQVIGQQNFQMGAVIGVVLLLPALLSFAVDRISRRKQVAYMTSRSIQYTPKQDRFRDGFLTAYCILVAFVLVGMISIAVWGSFITYWPYDLTLTAKNYDFNAIDNLGWPAFTNSLKLAIATATLGTILSFLTAYIVERVPGANFARNIIQVLAMSSLAVPGLVLGLSYVFFYSGRDNPLSFLYGTLTVLIFSSIAHFIAVAHITFGTALKQFDSEYENVSRSLKVPVAKMVLKVIVPLCLESILNVWFYLFVRAITTVSALIFLYTARTKTGSIAIINMDEWGFTAAAAGMATLIMGTSIVAKALQFALSSAMLKQTRGWRRK